MILPVAILAGGMGTRLYPATATIPKALIRINGVPFIEYQLRLLSTNGIRKVVICAGYRGDMLQNIVGDGTQFGLDVQFSFDGQLSLGTGGALLKALPLLGREFFVLYGDAYVLCNFRAVQTTWDIFTNADALMTVAQYMPDKHLSNVEFDNGLLLDYNKSYPTPRMQHFDYGLGICSSHAFDSFEYNKPLDLEVVYKQLLRHKRLSGLEIHDAVYEIGSFTGIEQFLLYCQGSG